MFHRYLSKMYDIPTHIYAIAIVVAVLLWAFLGKRYDNKPGWIVVNRVVACLSVVAVIVITLLVRPVQDTGVYLNPTYVLKLAQEFHDVYNQMMLNVVLFLPLGLSVPFALKWRHSAIFAILASLGFSLIIELLQYNLSRGYFEVSDLILNTSGALIGVCAFWLSRKLKI